MSEETEIKPVDAAYAKFHESRRLALVEYVDQQIAEHVADGGYDTLHARYDFALNGLRDLPLHSDRGVWNAAWEACREAGKQSTNQITK